MKGTASPAIKILRKVLVVKVLIIGDSFGTERIEMFIDSVVKPLQRAVSSSVEVAEYACRFISKIFVIVSLVNSIFSIFFY